MNNDKKSSNSHHKSMKKLDSGNVKTANLGNIVDNKIETIKKDYESSSEDEELETDNLIENILKTYVQNGGKDDNLIRTKAYLDEAFYTNTLVCLICISRIKRDHPIWYCIECYCLFHLNCIQRWSKDSIVQLKQSLADNPIRANDIKLLWGCPKCRHEYPSSDIPEKYLCYCKKTINPKFDPFLVPHSCGNICKKYLEPKCGHECLLLCHPGPCPPCPVTIKYKCYCSTSPAQIRRCSQKEWSCGAICGRLLTCKKHKCRAACHAGLCSPCPKKSLQKCLCQKKQKLRDCATPEWQCEEVCGLIYSCKLHRCEKVCHKNECGNCPLSEERICPCGKSRYLLPCSEETPTCFDTCDKLLDCGIHTCCKRCHKDSCGLCLEMVNKTCRCGLRSKEIQCYKEYFCEIKCKNIKDCYKHPCNRKCCDGNCPPCEKPCNRTLSCGNHKCTSICHRGPCYPCNLLETVSCFCGETTIQVSCGRKRRTKTPKCNKICTIPTLCHHKISEKHRCHFGDCPPCKQICDKLHKECLHRCTANCHSAVFVKTREEKKVAMPWDRTGPYFERRNLPCPPCKVPISITCLGGHETGDWPCHLAKPSSCGRSCGRLLACGNHTCKMECHQVISGPDSIQAGTNCEICESPCNKQRPKGCQHECPLSCHQSECPPCKNLVRIRCHCGLTQPYISCVDWLNLDKRNEVQSCNNQCPKNYPCGHRCRSNCHPGPCPNSESCRKKLKVTCSCKRIRKEFSCEIIQKNMAHVECDELCLKKKLKEETLKAAVDEKKKKEEDELNQKELLKYQKMFEGKKRNRERRLQKSEEKDSLLNKYQICMIIFVLLISVCLYLILMNG